MKNVKKKILLLLAAALCFIPAWAQFTAEELEAQMTEEVEVLNPVYMPVLGVGVGYLDFYGNVNDAFRSYTVGKPGIRVSMSTFLDKEKHKFRGNLVFLTGQLSGHQRSTPEIPYATVPENPSLTMTGNRNFNSNVYSFGINVQYNPTTALKRKTFEPFISLGIETLQFDTKGDYTWGDGQPYYFWTDGTIRVSPETSPADPAVEIVSPDHEYETDLRTEDQTGLGKYSQFTAAIPLEVGLDFNISGRVTLRAATSLHYAFTDVIDDMSSKSKTDYKGKRGSNMFTYSYLSLHVDLFSPPRTQIIENLTMDIDDFDMTMYDDQDGDGKFDGWDECPDTPQGAPIDSVGCPFDADADGVPDHIDREPASPAGAIVDEYGVEINENMVVEILSAASIRRSDVESYLMMHRVQTGARRGEAVPIPDRFKSVDSNSDGYISFDELLKVINDFFDGTSTYMPPDIKSLNDFFFEQ